VTQRLTVATRPRNVPVFLFASSRPLLVWLFFFLTQRETKQKRGVHHRHRVSNVNKRRMRVNGASDRQMTYRWCSHARCSHFLCPCNITTSTFLSCLCSSRSFFRNTWQNAMHTQQKYLRGLETTKRPRSKKEETRQ
jgi:hypothetical protein